MSNRNYKIIAVILAAFIAVCGVTNCYVRSSAAEIAATGYTVEKVLAVLLAVAGVALSESDYQMIWQDGKFDTSALLNNMQQYSRSLYNAVNNAMYLGASGVTKITLQQDIMSLLKIWAQQYFGTQVGERNIFGTIQTEPHVTTVQSPFNMTGSIVIDGSIMFQTVYSAYNSHYDTLFLYLGQPNDITYEFLVIPTREDLPYYSLQYLTTTKTNVTSNSAFSFFQSGTPRYTINGTSYQFYTYRAEYYRYNNAMYLLDTNSYYDATNVSNMAIFLSEYYNGSINLTSQENVNGEVIDNDGNAATLGGVIGAGTTAALDALGNVVLSGQATLTLPSDVAMENDLTDVVTGVLPWASFLEKLGLIAITGSETIEQINEQAQSLPTPSYNGAYSLDLTGLFPFCIPFDIVRILSAFNAPAEAPHFNWTLPTGYQNGQVAYETYTIDLSQFDTVAQVVRVFEYISFVLGLAIITRDLIRG